jgi:aminoglycoside phosphotransferase family enzyme
MYFPRLEHATGKVDELLVVPMRRRGLRLERAGEADAALRQPGAYPVPPAGVEAIETHMSWVFLTPDRVFKLKKPVRSDGLDFGTLERRRFFCEEEVRLNRRLAPSVYLDVRPLRADANGALGLWPEGEVVDWLVVMRRLPADRMLDRLLATGAAQAGDMRRLAALLSAFYASLPPVLHDPEVYCERLAREIAHHEARLCDPQLAFPVADVRAVCAHLWLFLQHRRDLLAARVRAGIALWHLKEPRYRGSPVWRERAGQYLRLAARHARDCTRN